MDRGGPDLKDVAREIFARALAGVDVRKAVEEAVRAGAGGLAGLRAGRRSEELGRVVIIAVGKAAGAMVWGLAAESPELRDDAEWIVVGPAGVGGALPIRLEAGRERVRVFDGGHPLPNEASLAAADEVLARLRGLQERDLAIFLVSGGASAMLERFLDADVTVAEMAAVHRALVESGAPIGEMNAVRKHLSALKGGRMAEAAAPARQVTLFVSDVPAGRLDALGSGPTVPDQSTVQEAYEVVRRYGLETRLPERVARVFRDRQLEETLKPGDAVFARSEWNVVLDERALLERAAEAARAMGYEVLIEDGCDEWEAERAAVLLVGRLRAAGGDGRRICVLSGGEVGVEVPEDATGTGGRNSHFCLLCARLIADLPGVAVLSCGSDGVDGRSEAAGGVVDMETEARAAAKGVSLSEALLRFDSGSLLERLGDAVVTGATGNNLRDLRVLISDGQLRQDLR